MICLHSLKAHTWICEGKWQATMYKCSVMTSSYKDTSLLEEERKRERESHQQQVLYQQCNQEQKRKGNQSTKSVQENKTSHIFSRSWSTSPDLTILHSKDHIKVERL